MKNTGYQQAVIAKKISRPGGLALDVDGNLCVESGKKQAILLLEGEENPFPDKYEVAGFFNYGDIIDGMDTRVYNPDACPVVITGFIRISPDKVELNESQSSQNITLISSHKWKIVSEIPDDIEFNLVSGESGETSIVVTRSETASEKEIEIEFENLISGDKAVLQITVSAAIPSVYPDVWDEAIIDDIAQSVCRIGEQVWTRKIVNYMPAGATFGQIDQTRLDNWKAAYSWANIDTTPEEYKEMFGVPFYSLAPLVNTINEMVTKQGNDIHKHMPPLTDDVKQLLGFTLCDVWDGSVAVDSSLAALTYGVLAIKGELTGKPGDDVRFTYPASWSRDILIAGSDKYGLALTGSGEFHRTDATNSGNSLKRLFIGGVHPLRDLSSGQPYHVNVMLYRQTDLSDISVMRYGVKCEPNMVTGGLAKGIRTMRYLELDYDIYSDGNEIRKINNGESVPNGFSVVPKGALRGAWFARPQYSLAQLTQIANYVNNNNEFAIG